MARLLSEFDLSPFTRSSIYLPYPCPAHAHPWQWRLCRNETEWLAWNRCSESEHTQMQSIADSGDSNTVTNMSRRTAVFSTCHWCLWFMTTNSIDKMRTLGCRQLVVSLELYVQLIHFTRINSRNGDANEWELLCFQQLLISFFISEKLLTRKSQQWPKANFSFQLVANCG